MENKNTIENTEEIKKETASEILEETKPAKVIEEKREPVKEIKLEDLEKISNEGLELQEPMGKEKDVFELPKREKVNLFDKKENTQKPAQKIPGEKKEPDNTTEKPVYKEKNPVLENLDAGLPDDNVPEQKIEDKKPDNMSMPLDDGLSSGGESSSDMSAGNPRVPTGLENLTAKQILDFAVNGYALWIPKFAHGYSKFDIRDIKKHVDHNELPPGFDKICEEQNKKNFIMLQIPEDEKKYLVECWMPVLKKWVESGRVKMTPETLAIFATLQVTAGMAYRTHAIKLDNADAIESALEKYARMINRPVNVTTDTKKAA